MSGARLSDLQPEWIVDYVPPDRSHRRCADLTPATAQGIIFLCPRCFRRNGGEVGTHSILVWFAGRGVPDNASPGEAFAPGENDTYPDGRPAQRWTAEGSGFGDLTLNPSIDLSRGRSCAWHGWVKNGEASDE